MGGLAGAYMDFEQPPKKTPFKNLMEEEEILEWLKFFFGEYQEKYCMTWAYEVFSDWLYNRWK